MLTIRLRFRSSNLCSICLTADYANNADSLVVAAFVSNAQRIKQVSLAASASLTVHKIGVIRGSMQSIFIQPFVTFTTALMNFAQMRRHFGIPRALWLKRCRSCHFAVPIFGQKAVGLTQSRWPGKH